MAIKQGTCVSGLQEFLRGVHQEKDTYKLALYGASAMLDCKTSVYTTAGEVTGKGYQAGGKTLSGIEYGVEGDVAYVGWTQSPVWADSSIAVLGGLIYNASKGNRALCVINFGGVLVSQNGPWAVKPGHLEAVIQLGGG